MNKRLSAIFTAFALVVMAALPSGVPARADSTNLIANPSVETSTAGAPDGWHDGTWGTNTHSATYENTGHTGTHSLKETVTAYTDGDSKWYFDDVAVTPGASYRFSNYYMSNIESEIDVQVTDSAGVQTFTRLVGVAPSPDAWNQATATFIAPANAKSVTVYQVIAAVGYVQVDDASLSAYTPAQFTRPLVSITFDDALANQYSAGLPVLDKYGAKGTYYILTGELGQPGSMDNAQIQTMYTDGQEIAAHTVTHPHMPTLTVAQMDQELSDPKILLQGLVGVAAAQNFATPYGEYNSTVITEIQKYYRSHRSTDEGYNSKDNFDIWNIKVQNILDSTTPAQVAAWVAQAQADKTWLVLVYHGVQSDPTAGVEDYSVTPENLDAEIAAIKASGVTIETLNDALNELLPQLGQTVPPAAKAGDINGDGTVDALDLSTLLINWNLTPSTAGQGDFNNDATVDALDLSTLLTNWSK